MRNPECDRTNPEYRSQYATLAAVRDAVVPVFAKHGVAVVQSRALDLLDTSRTEGETTVYERRMRIVVTTRLSAGDEWIETDTVVLAPDARLTRNGRMDMITPQGIASAGTYACRYGLMAIACVVGDDDDDANSAQPQPSHPQQPATIDHLRAELASLPAVQGHSADHVALAWVSWAVGSLIKSAEAMSQEQIAKALSRVPQMPRDGLRAVVERWSERALASEVAQ
jgi:hypothetical protein